jgi:ribosomal protein S18 acetylase RimI-like enzyme
MPVDVPQLLRLLQQDHPGIAGLSTTSMYRAVLRDCLRSRNLQCLVATRDAEVLGYVLVVRNWKRFQWMFVLRHPLLATEALAKRLRSLTLPGKDVPANGSEVGPIGPGSPDDGTRDKLGRTCRILYVGVDRAQRSHGIGSGLYAALRTHLEKGGVDQIEAYIAEHNLPSLRLHDRTGWSIAKRAGGGFVATLNVKDKD